LLVQKAKEMLKFENTILLSASKRPKQKLPEHKQQLKRKHQNHLRGHGA
jgi:hypothetical protein